MAQRLSYNYDYNCEKVSKMNEIESYVSILIENNKNYADELNLLRKENTDLRGQVEVLMGEMLKLKDNYEDSLADTKASYSKEIGALIDELKDILNRKEQMEGSYKSLLEELSYQSEFDRSSRAQQMEEIERNYENKLKILGDRIQEQNKQLQENFYLNSDSKIKMVKEIDSLRFQLGQLKKQNNDLLQSQAYHQNEINRLILSVKLISKEKEQLGVNLLKIEQDKNQTIIELRQSSAQLREQLNDHVDNLNKLDASLVAKEKELQNLSERYEHEQREKCEYEDAFHKASFQLSEKEAELASLKAELTKLNDLAAKETWRMTDLIKMLENDNHRLGKEKAELDTHNLEKQEEIYTLLQRIQKVERQLEHTNHQLANHQEENHELLKNNDLLKQQLEISLLEQKKYSEKCLLQTNHIETLETLLDKEKKRKNYNQSSNADREAVYSKQMSFESDINQRYELELQSMLREKSDLVSRFQSEKERLVRMYENALHEKEVTFKEKIHFLENQILQLSK